MTPGTRVLVLNLRDIANPSAGGAEQHLHALFRRLAARGHRITLYCGGYHGARRHETIDGIEIHRRGNRFTTAVWSTINYLRHRDDFDVIVDYTGQLHFLTPLYVRQPRIAVAMHVVGDVYRNDLPFPTGQLLAWWETFSLAHFYDKERFIAISQSTADELAAHGIQSGQIQLIHCGRHEPIPQPSVAKTSYPSLLYYGRLKRYKRVDMLLKALSEIRREIPEARLHVVGAGSELESLRRLAKDLGCGDAITFHGYLPDAERWDVVASCWVNVQPSLKEGWGLTVLEAAQCGVPTVASRVAGLRDAILEGETGELFDRADTGELVRKVTGLLRNSAQREALGARAREWSNSFSWDTASQELEQLIDTATSANPLAAPGEAGELGHSEIARRAPGAVGGRVDLIVDHEPQDDHRAQHEHHPAPVEAGSEPA
jgi:glycosyltransferase involved in cell wall biosynthesis